jgi:hypothetical protein
MVLPGALSSCSDGVRNGGEAGIDCGGICPAKCTVSLSSGGSHDLLVGLLVATAAVVCLAAGVVIRRRQRLARDRVSVHGRTTPASDLRDDDMGLCVCAPTLSDIQVVLFQLAVPCLIIFLCHPCATL